MVSGIGGPIFRPNYSYGGNKHGLLALSLAF